MQQGYSRRRVEKVFVTLDKIGPHTEFKEVSSFVTIHYKIYFHFILFCFSFHFNVSEVDKKMDI